MTTSNETNSAQTASCLAHLSRLGLAPDQVMAKVAELRPAVEAGDGVAMLAALDQASAWWAAYDDAQDIVGHHTTPCHLTHGWCDLTELVAQAPAISFLAVCAKARLAKWHWCDCGGDDAGWERDLARTLHEGMAMLAAEAQRNV